MASFIEYRNMSAMQNYKCAVCYKEERFMGDRRLEAKGYLGDLVVDHCHDTGKVRGLLCQDCNRALGGLKHDTEILTRAIEFLDGENEYK